MLPGSGPDSLDRRQAIRLPMALPVELEEGIGITRDVSLSGIFFETEQGFLPGEPIRFVLVLGPVSLGRPIRLECEGRVLRVEARDAEKVGMAVTIASYSFDTQGTRGTTQ